jgi:phenol 2-monooxygenase
MQFHHDGFRPGDPDLHEAAPGAGGPLPPKVDVLIVGCGPAGLTLAAQLSAFPGIVTRIVEQKSGPLRLGQADGIACRTMEMFQAFGFRERVEREAYWVNETVFWKPDEADRGSIRRHGRIQDVEDGLAPYPHVILNQARVHDFYLDIMRKSPRRLEPDYDRRLIGLTVDETAAADPAAHAVTARLERTDGSGAEEVKARYVVGCDGARSAVRNAIGLTLAGDSANQAWGVMDVLAVTSFPDIRLKALIQSDGEGSIVLIPREGGHLVRIYVELDKLRRDERVAARNITVERLIAATQRILRPYSFEVREVAWWSVYEIGQRLCPRFDDAPGDGSRGPRIFIAGDACHTHSPKAGQGMNVSMQDAFNLGWKLASVLRGQAQPHLLETYNAERQAVAAELISFDREWAAMLSAPLRKEPGGPGVDPSEVQDYFVRHGRYTAGTATHYGPSLLTGDGAHQHRAAGFPVGMRFHGAPVVRLADGKPMLLSEALEADGRWRLFLFAGRGDSGAGSGPVAALCRFLESADDSPLRRFTPDGADIDSVIDLRAVFQQDHRTLALGDMPPLLLPTKGRLGLTDYEKIFCAAPGRDIFDLRGIDREAGCLVVVRPDQYAAAVLPVEGHAALAAYFEGFMRRPS